MKYIVDYMLCLHLPHSWSDEYISDTSYNWNLRCLCSNGPRVEVAGGFFGWGAQLLTTSGENAEQDVICVGVTTCVAMDEVESNTGLDLN